MNLNFIFVFLIFAAFSISVRYPRTGQYQRRTDPRFLVQAKPFKIKDYKNRKLQQNYKQNGRMKIQKTLNRFQNQFSDIKFFSKSVKKFPRQHQNNAARVCNRLRVLTQNQVGFLKRFFYSALRLVVSSTNQRPFETLISKFQHNELLQECLKTQTFIKIVIFY